MASKYAGLKGKIPGEITKQEAALLAELATIGKLSIAELTAEYNAVADAIAKAAEETKRLGVMLKARKLRILDKITESGGDGFKGLHGFTWTESFEPYPACDDPAAAIQYFREHEMADLLELKANEVNSRVEAIVKEEAMRGELKIETEKVVDPATGEEREVQVVRSKIPGVRVFLDTKLSRVKSGNKSVPQKE